MACISICGWYNVVMFTASNTIHRAMIYYVSRYCKPPKKKIGLYKKHRFYYGDRDYYRNEYLKSDHWVSLRSKKLELNPCCQECGSDFMVEPHHKDYKNLYDVTLDDLKSLCRKCHNKVHEDLNTETRKIFGKLQEKMRSRQRRFAYRNWNIFRHRTRIIRNVSRMSGMSPEKVEFFLNNMGSKL